MYYSEYSEDTLHHVAELLLARRATGGECWCVFDNTTLGAASGNALELARLVQRSG